MPSRQDMTASGDRRWGRRRAPPVATNTSIGARLVRLILAATGFPRGSPQADCGRPGISLKVSFLAPPRTDTGGQEPPSAARADCSRWSPMSAHASAAPVAIAACSHVLPRRHVHQSTIDHLMSRCCSPINKLPGTWSAYDAQTRSDVGVVAAEQRSLVPTILLLGAARELHHAFSPQRACPDIRSRRVSHHGRSRTRRGIGPRTL